MAINGVKYNWEGVTIKAPNGTLFDVDSISYKDKRTINRTRGKGSRTRGYSRGAYEADGELNIMREELELMKKSFPNGIYSGKPFEITVSYSKEDGPTVTDVLQNCLFESRDFGTKSDDDSAMVKLSFQILGDIADGGKAPFPEQK